MEKLKALCRRFALWRHVDVSGVSGTGLVAAGVVLPDGQCVIQWVTTTSSMGIYKNFQELIEIHGHGNSTVIRWIDEPTN